MTHLFASMNRRSTRAALVLLGLGVAACNGAPGPDVASGVQAVSGSEQYAVTGSPAANPLVVLVTDENGNPFGNGKVVWSVSSGGGTVADSTSTSDATGHTSMTYTAGTNPGVATIVATVASVWTASFTIHIVALSCGRDGLAPARVSSGRGAGCVAPTAASAARSGRS